MPLPRKAQPGLKDIGLTVKVIARIDSLDNTILSIFQRYPSRSMKASSILSVLEYEGIVITPAHLRDRLRKLVILGLLIRHDGKRTDRYSLSQDHEDP
jgi:hypothetical protein